jgi:hypothetical protein
MQMNAATTSFLPKAIAKVPLRTLGLFITGLLAAAFAVYFGLRVEWWLVHDAFGTRVTRAVLSVPLGFTVVSFLSFRGALRRTQPDNRGTMWILTVGSIVLVFAFFTWVRREAALNAFRVLRVALMADYFAEKIDQLPAQERYERRMNLMKLSSAMRDARNDLSYSRGWVPSQGWAEVKEQLDASEKKLDDARNKFL